MLLSNEPKKSLSNSVWLLIQRASTYEHVLSVNKTHQGCLNAAFNEVNKILKYHKTRLYVWEEDKEKPDANDIFDVIYQPSIDKWEFAYFKQGLRIVKYDITCNGDYFNSDSVWIQRRYSENQLEISYNLMQGVYETESLAIDDRSNYNIHDYIFYLDYHQIDE